MENTGYIALSRLTALERQMEMVANNVANVNTTAFKGEDSMFAQHLIKVYSDDRTFKDKIAFTEDIGVVRDLTAGPIEMTHNPLDLAIHGDGYFVVQGEDGPLYTRSGRFRLDPEGQLVTNEGRPVLSAENDEPFFFAPNETQIDISKDGTVSTENGEIGQIKVVRFDREQDLKKKENAMFAAKDDMIPQDVEQRHIVQGGLEGSNVEPVIEMTKLISVHRAYQSVAKVLESDHQRQRNALQTLARLAR